MTEPAAEPTTGPMTGQPLRTDRFRVPMGDTDAAQVIYFGAPPRWAERLFTSYMADSGLPTSAVLASGGGFPAVELRVSYRRPLRLDDEVRGALRVHRRSARSITWQCDFFPGGEFTGNEPEVAVQVLITQVSVRMTNGQPLPVPLPAELISHLDRPPGEPR